MNIKEQLDLNRAFFNDCMDVMEPKSHDYATQGIVLVEMFRQAWELDITPQKVMWVLIRKHMTAIREYINSQKVESEPIDARLIDVANQMALLDIVINREKDLCHDISHFIQENESCERLMKSPLNAQPCDAEQEDKCERCGFLKWLVDRYENWDSKETSSESIQKQLDFFRGLYVK